MTTTPTEAAPTVGQRVIWISPLGKRIAATLVAVLDNGRVRLRFSPPVMIDRYWYREYDALAKDVEGL